MSELRRADVGDLDALAELEAACFTKPWTAAQLRSLTAESGREGGAACFTEWALLACDADGKIAGYIAWQSVLDTATLLRLAVRPEMRRRGLARRLLAASLLPLKNAGVLRLQLEVSEQNTAALTFYRSENFEQSACRKNYYGAGESALLMDCELKALHKKYFES